MTLSDFVAQNTGKKLLYPGQNPNLAGQCVQLVMLYMKQVQGVEPPVYPDAKDYWNNIPGYLPVNNPQDGDIAVYRGHDSFLQGHIAVVFHGLEFEQNADPDGSPAHLFNRSTIYLLGYLRKEDMFNLTKEQIEAISLMANNTTPGAGFNYAQYTGVPATQALLDQLINEFVPYSEKYHQEYSSLQQQVSHPPSLTPYAGPQLFTKS